MTDATVVPSSTPSVAEPTDENCAVRPCSSTSLMTLPQAAADEPTDVTSCSAEHEPRQSVGGAHLSGAPDESSFPPSHVQREASDVKQSSVARAAFERRDIEASRAEHDKPQEVEKHKRGASDYIKAIVFGGLDGIITTFAVVAAAAGSGDTWHTILTFGIANAIADAWSMGFGEYISGNAERDHALSERKREAWEVAVNIEGERREMVQIYLQRGYSPQDAEDIIRIVSKDEQRFVDFMMVEELGLLVDVDDRHGPMKRGAVMFTSFIFFGMFPLLTYFSGEGVGTDRIFGVSCGVTAFALVCLGLLRGYLSSTSLPQTALFMLLSGSISGGVSYGIGVLVHHLIN